jgi:hypothetical protein
MSWALVISDLDTSAKTIIIIFLKKVLLVLHHQLQLRRWKREARKRVKIVGNFTLSRAPTHQDWKRARTASNRFARDDKELEPQLGKQLHGERPRETAEPLHASPQPSRYVRRKFAAPLRGEEKNRPRHQRLCAVRLLTFVENWEYELDYADMIFEIRAATFLVIKVLSQLIKVAPPPFRRNKTCFRFEIAPCL